MRDVRAAGDQQGAMPASLSLLLDNASENSLPLTEPVPDAARTDVASRPYLRPIDCRVTEMSA
jgi:hypothetical protein